LIAGIDPGIKTGYALLDLNGNLVASGCMKEASDEKIVMVVSGIGIPVLIASDTSPPSHFVQKIAARLNVKVSAPKESMTKLEKRNIGRDIEDVHIRDAYAAAVKAFRRFANRLRQIDAMHVDKKDELKKMVITGERIAERLESQRFIYEK
jgi:predicted RNase H-like nuclease (RuvC/YqgF family)